MENILQNVEKMNDQIIAWRRDLHQIAEIGNDLPKTAEYIKSELDKMDVVYTEFDTHSGIVAIIGKGEKTIGLRADMDALPVVEETGLPFACENGNMHACGHDAHMALLLSAAKAFKDMENELEGKVKLIFQPGEEGTGGAAIMAKEGVLKNPDVDAIVALHVGTFVKNINSGDVVIGYDSVFASSFDEVHITVKGKGGHGAEPHLAVDPIAISAIILNAAQLAISREFDANKAGVFTIATMSGGTGAFNIIDDTVELKGTIRAQNNENRDFIFSRVKEIATGIAKAMRADCEVKYHEPVNPVINDRKVTDVVIEAARKVVPQENLVMQDKTLMIGEDASEFWDLVPGTYFFLGTEKADGVPESKLHHNSRFDLDETYLYRGAAVMVQSALDLMKKY